MATYKVLQDIEAEDKILGPLTLKQFIFAIITLCLIFAAIFSARVSGFLIIPWLLPILFFGFMASPIGKDQPNDVWLAARIRFLIKPRRRIWDQAGMQELVTITAPKKIELSRTDGLSQTEVKSRLSALSSLMDTRGWAVKDSAGPSFGPYGSSNVLSGDRLFDLSPTESAFSALNLTDAEDVLDETHNSTAQRIASAIKTRQTNKIEALKQQMKSGSISSTQQASAQPKQDFSFINREPVYIEPGYATFGDKVITPGSKDVDEDFIVDANKSTISASEEALLNKIHHTKELQEEINKTTHDHRIEPTKNEPENTSVNNNPDGIIKQLGQANDISVASIANLAKHAESEVTLSDDDVVSLH